MIVVVDDERTMPGADRHCRTSAEALALLSGRPAISQLWLDHDLGGQDTTRPVALWLAEMAFNGDPYPVDRIFVHTANSVGRTWLVSTLERWYDVAAQSASTVSGFVPDPALIARREP